MSMPEPGPFHEALHCLVGRWRGKETMHPSPWSMEGHVADGEIENRLALGGFGVIQEYRQVLEGQTVYEGHGVITYDDQAGLYRMHWWDSMGTPCNVFSGQFAGKVLELTGKNPMVTSRGTFQLERAEEGHYGFVMSVSLDGENFAPFMEGEYERQD